MKKLKIILALAVCRTLHFFIRLMHRGGTAFPGRIALKICPDLLSVLSRGVNTVAITGTNGKTTSSRMVEKAFSDAGIDCLANRSGANLISGITTEFALNSTLGGTCRKKWAVIECDEAAAVRTLAQLKPKVVLVTNLFRDQLDRYGEVTHTLENIRTGLSAVPDAVLCLNADCSLTSSLAEDLPNKAVFFGIESSAAADGQPSELSDATHCIKCRHEYEYDYVTYGHLGGFRCPECGYRRHDTQVGVVSIDAMDADGSSVTMDVFARRMSIRINLPALYNIYNAAGAMAAAVQMGIDADTAAGAIGTFQCGFGRMEHFDLGTCGAKMMLVKNPAGCNQVIDFLSDADGEFDLVVCLNDNGADGTDVSWIWDADFEKLGCAAERLHSVTVSGIRAADMWTRLKYAGIPSEKISMETDYERLSQKISDMDRPVFIIPTYTAMLDLRACLIRRCGGKDFWEG